jgi:hypothetical protein
VLPALATLTQLEHLGVYVPLHQNNCSWDGKWWGAPGAVGALSALTGLTSLVAFGASGDAFDAWAQVLGSLSALLELQMHVDKELPGAPLFAAIGALPRLRALRLVFSVCPCCYEVGRRDVSEQSADALRGIPQLELLFQPKIRECSSIARLMQLPNLRLTVWWGSTCWRATYGPGACCCWECAPRDG